MNRTINVKFSEEQSYMIFFFSFIINSTSYIYLCVYNKLFKIHTYDLPKKEIL